ncbi:josephin-2 isoform X1 [Haemorhous mexicanus]|uniref:josephin-2 isoform X1 n=1 Tax=Haemorhous mexicanus TaxID=30427 RepID=UPI0028BE1443|nr:josephin-2 isoform X1 [Haemorhous mexicanus]
MAPEDARAPQASPSPSPDLGGVLEDLPDLGRGLPGFGSGVPGYHERQRRQLCALHALNNLLQRPWLSQASADRICQRPPRLAPNSRPNPHRSLLGTGNYDVNVVMAALGTLGLAAVWWDKRRPLERLCLSHVLGFLLNVPSRVALGTLALPLSRPHWLCVRPFGGTFYNLDSKLATPTAIGAEPQLREFLRAALAQGPSELFLVVARDVEEAGTWLSPE